MNEPKLYGIENSNRLGANLWGKNQFNSTFPVALCCYMRDRGLKPVYISVDENFDHDISDEKISVADVFGTAATGDGIRFEFETEAESLSRYATEPLGATDLVTVEPPGTELRALEIKLTVLPDNATAELDETAWGTELVVRPITSAYATLGIWDQLLNNGLSDQVRRVVEPVATEIQSWDNRAEMMGIMDELIQALSVAGSMCHAVQRPFLIQPIWKTEGKSPALAEKCFDVFVWSDLALWRLFVGAASRGSARRLTRTQRECARTVRCIYDLTTRGRIDYDAIYRGMGLGSQTDKACAFSGKATHPFMQHSRLTEPALYRSVLSSIILGGGEAMLSPERRFDASVYFAWRARMERGETGQSL